MPLVVGSSLKNNNLKFEHENVYAEHLAYLNCQILHAHRLHEHMLYLNLYITVLFTLINYFVRQHANEIS